MDNRNMECTTKDKVFRKWGILGGAIAAAAAQLQIAFVTPILHRLGKC